VLKEKRIILFLILSFIVLSVNCAYALESNFQTVITPVRNIIFEDEVGEYNLTVFNDADFEENLMTPYTSDSDWIITTDPQVFRIPPKTAMTYRMVVQPKTEVIPGQYGPTLNVRSIITDYTDKNMLIIFIKPLNPLPMGYLSSIALNIEILTQIDPRNEIPLKVYLRNRNAKEYNNLTVKIESRLLNKEYTLPFKPLEEKTEEFIFQLDPYQAPTDDKLIVTISNGNETINQIKVPIRVILYSEVKEEVNVDERFLKTITTVRLTNFGNIENKTPYKYDMNFIEKYFIFTNPDNSYIIKDNKKRQLIFPIDILPGDTVTLEITKNYRFAAYTIIIIIILIILYYQLRSPVIVKKDAMGNEPSHDGVSEFKVKVLIKNRSQKPVENVKIIEMIPSLALLVKEASVGTVEPTKIIRNDSKGTLVRWDINYLEPFEERIITYRLKSKLNIVGGLTLQATKVKFETVTGRERVTYSKKHNIKIYA
jgi:hypothetical protein